MSAGNKKLPRRVLNTETGRSAQNVNLTRRFKYEENDRSSITEENDSNGETSFGGEEGRQSIWRE